MATSVISESGTMDGSALRTQHQAPEAQPKERAIARSIALPVHICMVSIENLNQVLADTMALRDLYKKHHWQTAGPTFYSLHLLFDKHHGEQSALVDAIAERIQMLGGVSIAVAHDVADTTQIPRAPRCREGAPAQLARLLQAHEIVLQEARVMARRAAELGDDGTSDLLVGGVIRCNEMQVWFVAEHLDGMPLDLAQRITA